MLKKNCDYGLQTPFSSPSLWRLSKPQLFLYVALSMDFSNSFPLHLLLSATHQAILQPHAKSSSKESLTCALRLPLSGTIWLLSDMAFVAYGGKCLPTRQLCLFWAQNHSHLCTVALAMCQHDHQSFFLLSFNTTTSAKPCWHHLPGITEDHLALWLPSSLSKSCWKRRLRIETYQVVCDNAGEQGPHSISSYDTLQRGLKEPFCFSLRFTEVCSFLTQSPVFPKSYKRVLGSLEMLRFEYHNCQWWFVVWSVMKSKWINSLMLTLGPFPSETLDFWANSELVKCPWEKAIREGWSRT